MKRILLSLGAVSAVVLFASLYGADAQPGGQKDAGKPAPPALAPDFAAATFNGKEITVAAVDAEIQRKPQFAMLQTYSGGDPEVMNRLRVAAVNSLINRQLLLGAAKGSGVIDETEISSSVANLVQQYGGKEKLTPLLQNIKTNYESFTEEVADDFRINSFIDKDVAKGVKVSEDEAKKAFDAEPTKYAAQEAIKASHILIKVAADATPEQDKAAKGKIEELHAKAVAPGADFGALAKAHSEDGSAQNGGELGLIQRGRTVPAFENAAFALKAGEISAPVRSEFGYHIIKVTERKDAEKPDFAKARPLIEQEILQKKKSELVEKRLMELRAAAQVKINLPQG